MSSTTRASGSGLSGVGKFGSRRGSVGARETAFASMRLGSSAMTGSKWILGRSVDEGEDQPGWFIRPHDGRGSLMLGRVLPVVIPRSSGPWAPLF